MFWELSNGKVLIKNRNNLYGQRIFLYELYFILDFFVF